MAFRSINSVGSRNFEFVSGLHHAACTHPVYASRPQLPADHATLGSGWSLALPGRIVPCRAPRKVSALERFLLSQASPGALIAQSRVRRGKVRRCRRRREGALVRGARRRAKGREIGVSLPTPPKLQRLQAALGAKAKQEPAYRFYALYDKVYRADVLAHAYALSRQAGGAPGVDGQTFADIEAQGRERWLAELGEDLRQHRYQPQPVRRVTIPKPGGVGDR